MRSSDGSKTSSGQTSTRAPGVDERTLCEWCEDGGITGIVGKCRKPFTKTQRFDHGKTLRFCDDHFDFREHMRPATLEQARAAFAKIYDAVAAVTSKPLQAFGRHQRQRGADGRNISDAARAELDALKTMKDAKTAAAEPGSEG